ncbi:MAG: precorrin-4 C(11)-methyltransferase [Desulfobacteraceae bacterium]|nr:precorrin-4 C(11)-methyltransferase [Desulfobacteraceae bacterium]
MNKEYKPVLFVGAGPGDPDLITVKGMNALKHADVIIYAGSLVPKKLLTWAKQNAETLNSASMHLDEIVEKIRSSYFEGKKVVRLHTGDPSLYGAILEQFLELKKLEIKYETIPGVTAAFAAAAAMNMEYTLPEITQTLILTRISGRTPVPDLEDLDKLCSHKSSIAIYLSIGHLKRVEKILSDSYGKESLCAIAYRVGFEEEKIVYCNASKLAEYAKKEKINKQALIIAGKAVEASVANKDITKSKLYDITFSHEYRTKK